MAHGLSRIRKRTQRRESQGYIMKRKPHDIVYKDMETNFVPATNEDAPGLGQFYCVSCSRYFIDNNVLQKHLLTKRHKQRYKEVLKTPYTEESSLLAAEVFVETPIYNSSKMQN